MTEAEIEQEVESDRDHCNFMFALETQALFSRDFPELRTFQTEMDASSMDEMLDNWPAVTVDATSNGSISRCQETSH
jgi:hypothetical protein